MKTFFAIIGFGVVALWAWHFMGDKVIKPAANTAWQASAPYINDAVNKAQK